VLLFMSFSLVIKHWLLSNGFTFFLHPFHSSYNRCALVAAMKVNTNNILVGSGYYYLLDSLDPLGGEFLISLADTQLVCHN